MNKIENSGIGEVYKYMYPSLVNPTCHLGRFSKNKTMLEIEYLGNYPNAKETQWSNKCQGVTHDADHWYITQTLQIWKIPASADLDFNEKTSATQVSPLPKHLQKVGYNHFGDLDYWEGYLFISLENKRKKNPPAIVLWDNKNWHQVSGSFVGLIRFH